MTHPPQPPGPHPFGGNPFGPTQPSGPPVAPAPMPPGPRGEANTLATLSIIFAFLFAPAGAILGHRGLSQIARTGQRGRERALVGITLSYLIAAAVTVTLVAWTTLGHNTHQPAAARPGPTQTKAVEPPARSAPPKPAVVAPADVVSLMPDLQQVKDITGNQKLTAGPTSREMSTGGVIVDRKECWAVMAVGAPDAYNRQVVRGYDEAEYLEETDPTHPMIIASAIVAFDDAPAARAQLTDLLSQWRQCITAPARITYPSGQAANATFTPVADAGDGITTTEVHVLRSTETVVRAVTVKANIVVESMIVTAGADTEHTLAFTKFVLNKIPG